MNDYDGYEYEMDDCEKGLCSHGQCKLHALGRKAEIPDYELHLEAGLVYSGMNAEYETEWIGTKQDWQKYEDLKEAANK